MVRSHHIQTIAIETDMLLQNREGLLVHNEPKLLGCNLLGISLVRLEQVVIQVLGDLNSGSDIVAVRRKDDRLQFGKLSDARLASTEPEVYNCNFVFSKNNYSKNGLINGHFCIIITFKIYLLIYNYPNL